MPALHTLISILLLALCLNLPTLQAAEPPSRDAVQNSLANLADRKLPEAEEAAIQQLLEQTLGQLDQLQATQQRLVDLKRLLADAPGQIAAARRDLARLRETPVEDIAVRYANTEAPQLEEQLSSRGNQLSAWQEARGAANSRAIAALTRPERAPLEIGQNQARIQQINDTLKADKTDGTPLSPERRDQLNAELAALQALNELRRQELANNNLLQDLGSSQRDLLDERIGRMEKDVQALQSLINQKRLAQSEATYAELSRNANINHGGLLAKEGEANLKLSNDLLRTTDRLNELTQRNLETKQKLDTLNQNEEALHEQIEVLRGSLLLAKILFRQKMALPVVETDATLADNVADIRLYQFELAQQREQLKDPAAYVDQLLASQPATDSQISPQQRDDLLQLVRTRSDLIEQLNRELNVLLNEAITLQMNQQQLFDTAKHLRTTLEEQLFWIPSNKPMDLDWLKAAPRQIEQQVGHVPWTSVLKELGAGLLKRPLIFLPLLLMMGVLLWRRREITQRLAKLHRDVGHYQRDNQLNTPLALLFNLLLALPGTLFLALCGYALQSDARGQNAYLGAALIDMAAAWLVLYTTYRVLSPGGVAELHFGWARPQVAFLRKQMRHLGLVVLALVGVAGFTENQPIIPENDVFGNLVLLTGYLMMCWLLAKVLLRGPASGNASPLSLLIGLLFTLLPLGMVVALGLGYYYTTLKLSGRLVETMYVLLFWVVIEATLVRGLSVAARRLAYQRALTKRQTAQADGGSDGETPEAPVLDIEQVNQQSLRLIRLTLFGLLLGSLYWVWADLITVVDYLETIKLYQFSSGSGATATQVAISLRDLLASLLVGAITVVLARNLPGLLEVLVLSRLKLAQGSAYAATTLLSYVIYGFGLVTSLSILGVSWDKLQWLVAALSVGIGFGMQEIIANFISGLIILFERPVRIGDMVTVSGVSGSVNKIRIRATHILDADRKVVVVPNKTFITSQLTNWTLGDTVTRLVLKVGVGYGSNLELVRKLLYQAANENPRVMHDPEPLVLFQSFGESTLDHDLVIHVRELGDRSRATDEINRRIDELFRQNDIDIAFRQVDVFVKNLEGQEAQIERGAAVLGAAGAAAAESKNALPGQAVQGKA